MDQVVYRYSFVDAFSLETAEELLHLSIHAVEGIHGEAQVRLDAGYAISSEKRTIAIDASTAVGRNLCAVFVGLLLEELGQDAFHVRRVHPDSTTPSSSRRGSGVGI